MFTRKQPPGTLLLACAALLLGACAAGRASAPQQRSTRPRAATKPSAAKAPAAARPVPANAPFLLQNGQGIRAERNGIYIIDATPRNIAEPRTHVVYNFEKNTVSLVEIRSTAITVQTKELTPAAAARPDTTRH